MLFMIYRMTGISLKSAISEPADRRSQISFVAGGLFFGGVVILNFNDPIRELTKMNSGLDLLRNPYGLSSCFL